MRETRVDGARQDHASGGQSLGASPSSIPILMYHSVRAEPSPKFAPFAVTPREFAAQMAYLAEHGYTTLTASALAAARAGGATLPARPIVLTFDDGFADFHETALPILLRHHLTATMYLVSGLVGGTARWLWREGAADMRLMSWEQIAEIAARGIECGAHSHTHPPLDLLPLGQLRDEVRRSKDLLEERLGRPVPAFAYPYGYQTATTRRVVREAGFTSACAVRYRLCTPQDDPFMLARLKIARGTSVDEFARQVAGKQSAVVPALYAARTRAWRLARAVAGHLPAGARQGKEHDAWKS